MALPPDVERDVVTRLFDDMERLGWTEMPLRERSRRYERWYDDPDVGGVLRKFMPDERVRVWMKDIPVKEFARAKAGIGKFAPLVADPASSPETIVAKGLGREWQVVPDSLRMKPLRVRASDGNATVTVAWGPVRDLKHLVWAAIHALATGDDTRWVLCLTAPLTKTAAANEKKLHQAIALRCGVEIVHVTL